MKYIISLFIIIFITLAIKKIYAFKVAQHSCFKNISNSEFKELGKDKNSYIIDVRTKAEFEQGSIETARNNDVLSGEFKTLIDKLDRDKIYLVYCRSGSRSLKACSAMCDMGFKNVYNLSNGYMGWSN